MGNTINTSREPYDFVVKINSLLSVNDGWDIVAAPPLHQTLLDEGENLGSQWKGSIVSMLGFYNKGKTFLLNKLAGATFASGQTVNTEGLSFKLIEKKEFKAIVIDTAGLESPVCGAPNDRDKNDKNPDDILAEKLADRAFTDYFLSDVVYQLSDFYIIVVNNLLVSEQKLICRLTKAMKMEHQKHSDNGTRRHGATSRPLIVVHNFNTATSKKEALKLWESQVVNIFDGQLETVEIQSVDFGRKTPTYLNTPYCHHVWIGKDDKSSDRDLVEHNQVVYELLRKWLTINQPFSKGELPLQKLQKIGAESLQKFVQTDGIPTLVLDRDLLQKSVKLRSPEKVAELKAWTLDPTLGFVYNQRELAINDYEDGDKRIIEIEIPGATNNTVDIDLEADRVEVKYRVPARPRGPNAKVLFESRRIGAAEEKWTRQIDPTRHSHLNAAFNVKDGVLTIILSAQGGKVKPQRVDI